jgi:hypothetical protein
MGLVRRDTNTHKDQPSREEHQNRTIYYHVRDAICCSSIYSADSFELMPDVKTRLNCR